MKILFTSYAFPPSIGGIETVSALLAPEFVRLGHEVRAVTETPGGMETDSYSYEVIRQPSPAQLLKLVSWSELVFHNNISLRSAWPLLFMRRPWVIAHHTWIERGFAGTLKRFVSRFATNIAISRVIAEALPVSSIVIPNPYNASLFQNSTAPRERELLFVGRLVRDKGVHVLIQALERLKHVGLRPRLTIVGSGPEEQSLLRQVNDLGLSQTVMFAGIERGRALADEMCRHLILVVPSLWNEPFGVVALEGMACGCVVVGSAGGGLADAIGSCGVTFPNGDATALSECLTRLLLFQEDRRSFLARVPSHLQNHTVERIAQQYTEVFAKAAGRDKTVLTPIREGF